TRRDRRFPDRFLHATRTAAPELRQFFFLGIDSWDPQITQIRPQIVSNSFHLCNLRNLRTIILVLPASLRRDRLEFLAENAKAAGRRRRSRRSGACADR